MGTRDTRRVDVAGTSGISAAATAAVVTVNVAASAGSGDLYVYPTGSDRPRSPLVEYRAKHRSSVQTVVPIGKRGSITVENVGRSSKAVDVDVVAAYQPSSMAGGYGFVARRKIATVVNTRSNVGIARLNSGVTKTVSLSGQVAAGTKAVLLQVTVRRPDTETRLTFWRADGRRPGTIDAAAPAGQSVSTTVLAQLSSHGELKLRNAGADGVDLVVSLVGSYR